MFHTCAAALVMSCMQLLSATAPAAPGHDGHISPSQDARSLASLYYGYQARGMASAPDFYTIPRKIHFIWLDNGALPQKEKQNVKAWQRMHPGWEVTVWTKANLGRMKIFDKMAQKAFRHAKTKEEQSRILRYAILNSEGGVYIDLGVKCNEPINHLHKLAACYAVIKPHTHNAILSEDIIGSAAHHPILQAYFNELVATKKPGKGEKKQRDLTNVFLALGSKFYGKAVPLPSDFSCFRLNESCGSECTE